MIRAAALLAWLTLVASAALAQTPFVPLPADVSVTAPAADVPPAMARFSGVWAHGAWYGELPHVLIVERVDSDGRAAVVYAVGESSDLYVKPARRVSPATSRTASWASSCATGLRGRVPLRRRPAARPLSLQLLDGLRHALTRDPGRGRQPWADASRLLMAGTSRGGFLSVVYAGERPQRVKGVVNFVGGWTGETTALPRSARTTTPSSRPAAAARCMSIRATATTSPTTPRAGKRRRMLISPGSA